MHNNINIIDGNPVLGGWIVRASVLTVLTISTISAIHLAYGWVDGTGLGIDYID